MAISRDATTRARRDELLKNNNNNNVKNLNEPGDVGQPEVGPSSGGRSLASHCIEVLKSYHVSKEEASSFARSLIPRNIWRPFSGHEEGVSLHRRPDGETLLKQGQRQPAPGLDKMAPLREEKRRQQDRPWSPVVLVYDTQACTKEEHDPALALLYYRPRSTAMTTRAAIAGQIMGVLHFCRGSFSTPTMLHSRHAHFAIKDYGRFVMMVGGAKREWASSGLQNLSQLLEAAVGGLPALWTATGCDVTTFSQRLNSLLDTLVLRALPKANFKDDLYEKCDSVATSPSLSPRSETGSAAPEDAAAAVAVGEELVEEEPPVEAMVAHEEGEAKEEEEEEKKMEMLHSVFAAVPSVQLPKSGGGVFLRAQQVIETCQQQPGVLAGTTVHHGRVLSSQLDPHLTRTLMQLTQPTSVLEDQDVNFQLPEGVCIQKLYIQKAAYTTLINALPKALPRRGERGLHGEVAHTDLSLLRSVLRSNQSLHSYPSTLPSSTSSSIDSQLIPTIMPPAKGHIDPLKMCAKINKNNDLLADGRPSQSLPGSPRKIRVAAMLPEVGSNSPDLRYKVLTNRKPRTSGVNSTHNTPRRLPGNRMGIVSNRGGLGGNGAANSMGPPELKSNGFNMSKRGYGIGHKGLPSYITDKNMESVLVQTIADPTSPIVKHNGLAVSKARYEKEKNESGFEDGTQSDSELNVKNTKNRLNLHFAPDKINRPSEDRNVDSINGTCRNYKKAEINGNLTKAETDGEAHLNGNMKSQVEENKDDDDTSKSEDSEISVLELSSFMDTKDNNDDKRLIGLNNELLSSTERLHVEGKQLSFELETNSQSHLTESAQHEALSGEEDGRGGDGHQQSVSGRLLNVYLHQQSNMRLLLLLSPEAAHNPDFIYSLWRIGSSTLMDVEATILRALDAAEDRGGDSFLQCSYAVLTAPSAATLHVPLISQAHHNFVYNPELMEITMRSGDTLIWGHRHSNTETFYQATGVWRPGLPIPSDMMAKMPHRARRRLERDHAVTVL
ncbi:Hermansky-Pudlak syndrome 4 protein isoform X2 [Oratosquilla oratoria]|uniref:Hermansky-Pudlak syndrome 4 protein isoform X2 n=1 Tax=Oratosquilla oratoria TaxID=337810 RepID=UPI003F7624C6